MPGSHLTSSFRKASVIKPLHTGGPFAIAHEGAAIVTCTEERVILTDIYEDSEICSYQDTSSVTSLCTSPDSKWLVIFTESHSLRIFPIPQLSSRESQPLSATRHIARAHDAPVHVSAIDVSSQFIASGSADGVVKVWDLHRGYVTHLFRGHGGVVSALSFQQITPSDSTAPATFKLFTASVDTRVRVFDLSSSVSRTAKAKPEAVLEGHESVPRSLAMTSDGRWLLSGGRDGLVNIWELRSSNHLKKTYQLAKKFTVKERIESLGIVHLTVPSTSREGILQFYTAGERGVIRIWDAWTGKLVASTELRNPSIAPDLHDEQHQIMSVVHIPTRAQLVSLHADQNILFHSLPSLKLDHQLIGYNDEITDVRFLRLSSEKQLSDSHIAVATNSSLIRVYSTTNHDARLLSGHENTVLCLDTNADGDILASGSKDRSARLWQRSQKNMADNESWACIAICEGHTESVGAIALSRVSDKQKARFMFTGSQDRTIKMWYLEDIGSSHDGPASKPRGLATHKAHDKDINSLDIAPNDALLASGSQDKTAKIFEIDFSQTSSGVRGQIRQVGTCKGHKRGVWSVRFGKTSKVLATASGDKTIKLWTLEDFSCIKTFEGHTNSVLRVDFVNDDRQILSSASDGLVKLWSVQEDECVATMDNHEEKVWALAVSSSQRTVVSGGADSMITFWEDSTEEEERQKNLKQEELITREQDFANYVVMHDYRNAIYLALEMDHPRRLLNLFAQVYTDVHRAQANISQSARSTVDRVLQTMPLPSLRKLFVHIRTWNISARNSGVAQTVLHAILRLRSGQDLARAFDDSDLAKSTTSFKEVLDGVIPYTERHLMRLEKLSQDSFILDLILAEMDGGIFSS